jgi:hypothetical protein
VYHRPVGGDQHELPCQTELSPCRYEGLTSNPGRSGPRSGVPEKRRSGPGLRTGGPRALDLRPET